MNSSIAIHRDAAGRNMSIDRKNAFFVPRILRKTSG